MSEDKMRHLDIIRNHIARLESFSRFLSYPTNRSRFEPEELKRRLENHLSEASSLAIQARFSAPEFHKKTEVTVNEAMHLVIVFSSLLYLASALEVKITYPDR